MWSQSRVGPDFLVAFLIGHRAPAVVQVAEPPVASGQYADQHHTHGRAIAHSGGSIAGRMFQVISACLAIPPTITLRST